MTNIFMLLRTRSSLCAQKAHFPCLLEWAYDQIKINFKLRLFQNHLGVFDGRMKRGTLIPCETFMMKLMITF